MFNAFKVAVVTAFFWGIFEGLIGYMSMFNINVSVLNSIHDSFPLANYRLGWISVTVIASLLGYALSNVTVSKKAVQ
ncbi:MAG: branched-chain amino acid transport system II carrier protein [Vallitalea sp.]|jgi:branched-subunit amino acid permease|nr:branched-chain amino acid transport system II carrier protein [Vallitalea sp.]